jgi:hypothetical protein
MTRKVLGFCSTYSPAFAFVLAEAIDEADLERIPHALAAFPPKGSIYVPWDFKPHDFRYPDIGFWLVQEDPNYPDEKHSSRYRATARIADLPAEIIRINCLSDDAESARNIIAEDGMAHESHLDGRRILLEFTDGVIAGPVRLEQGGTPGRYRIPAGPSLWMPLAAWSSIKNLSPLDLRIGNATRTFASKLTLPAPTKYLDLAPPEYVLKKLLEKGCKQGKGKYLLSETQRDEVIGRLVALQQDGITPERIERLKGLLKTAAETGAYLDQAIDALLAHEDVRKGIEERKRLAADEARQELRQQEKELVDHIGELQTQEAGLKQSIGEWEQKSRVAEEQAKQQEEAALSAIAGRVRQAQEQAPHLLAEIAVLRPFLSDGRPTPPVAAGDSPVALPLDRWTEEPYTILNDWQAAMEHLNWNLEIIGLDNHEAGLLAEEILSAICLGQWVLFEGSLAAPVATAVMRSLACQHSTVCTVPVGLVSADPLARELRELASGANGTALLLEGVNRSGWDAYASTVVQLVGDRALRGETGPPALLGTLVDGPSALPPTGTLLAMGPVFHTDCFYWPMQQNRGSIRPGQLATSCGPKTAAKPPADKLDGLLKALASWPNVVWRKNLQAAFQMFHALRTGKKGPAVLDRVAFSWVLPRAAAVGADLAAIKEILGETADERVRCLLQMHEGRPT